jgi:hypothetical protein
MTTCFNDGILVLVFRVVSGERSVLAGVSPEFLPGHQRSKGFTDPKLILANWNDKGLDLFRPVGLECTWLCPPSCSREVRLLEGLLALKMLSEEFESFPLADV